MSYYSKLSTDVSISWVENQTVVIPAKKEEKLSIPKAINPPGTELKTSEVKKTEVVTELKNEEPKLKPKDFLPFKDVLETIKKKFEIIKKFFELYANKLFDEIKKYQEVNMLILEIVSGFAVFVLVITLVLFKRHRRKHKEEAL